ncbi:Nucleoside triphosphate pyrophosphatase Maf-like protein like protein [Aduncisulcus paluster]|uniref:Nucleoside triphosphate pyrophosphatase Maf-like protein like protein n=1 Tax=Aduncisulcus paluster TaxID=2918883 RepID=A0ABQ5KP61_9EUKA|nr:Nucleoside triphosphate pyrophosphatase Maf-like protein like protein [Aduncisulcus paluster]
MILHLLEKLNSKKIILGSGSPRRKELLSQIGVKFEIIKSKFDEDTVDISLRPDDYVTASAVGKAQWVVDHCQAQDKEWDLIIGVDTVVIFPEHKTHRGSPIVGKPKDTKDLLEILSKLSGSTHRVISGVCMVINGKYSKDGKNSVVSFHDTTELTFGDIPVALIEEYSKSSEPYDKAGGYAIQGTASTWCTEMHGSYFNVMGFPLHKISKELANFIIKTE